jgi:ribose/xylose/arabinose/galactoside ABC-type transport system permease subunit
MHGKEGLAGMDIEKTNGGVLSYLFRRDNGMIYILIGLIVFFSLVSDEFLSLYNFSNILIVQVVVGCVAIGAMFILIIGEFDLSLGYMLGFLMVLGAFLTEKGAPAPLIILAMVGTGALAGLLSGFLSVVCKISSFVATLAVGVLLSGLSLGVSGGATFKNVPQILLTIGQDKVFGFAWCVWIFAIVCVAVFFILEYSPFGRHLYAIGGSERIAFLSGIKTTKARLIAFVLAGLFTGIGSVFQLGESGAAFPAFGYTMLLPAYAAVFLGVTVFKPGNYNLVGLVLSLVVIGVGVNGLMLVGAPFWAESVFNGSVLLVAVLTAKQESRSI